ncbi:hypothetical protein [Hubei virga-like virus 17]|uniref:hypothetical protein n=1 Tax=Hubei virga-like virus 17 TaxID=1923332 RepID=UPI00090ABB73|nr:hypothetical protein [Hubei virga-like virus 17]APG77662.1 hypothetical protein [Hubei virga-like virus 17]
MEAQPQQMQGNGRTGWRVENKVGDLDIISDVLGAYKRLPMYPFPMFVLMLTLIVGLAEIYNGGEKPLEYLLNGIQADLNNENIPTWEKTALKICKYVLEFIIAHKIKVFGFLMISIPVIIRPSKNNVYIWVLLVAILIMMRNWGFFEYIVIGNLFYIYTQLLSLTNKFLIAMLIVVVVLWNFVLPVKSNKIPPGAPSPPPVVSGPAPPSRKT